MAVDAVQTRLVLSVSDVKSLLGITVATFDDLIDMFLTAGKEEADMYMTNPFLELREDAVQVAAFGEHAACLDITRSTALVTDTCKRTHLYALPPVELVIPSAVKMGVLEYVRWNLSNQGHAPGVSQEKVGDIQRSYAVYASVDDMLKNVTNTFWSRYRLEPGSARPEGYI